MMTDCGWWRNLNCLKVETMECSIWIFYLSKRNWRFLRDFSNSNLSTFSHPELNERTDLLFWFSANSIDWKPCAFSERSAMIWLGSKVFKDLLTRERRMHGVCEESSEILDCFGYSMAMGSWKHWYWILFKNNWAYFTSVEEFINLTLNSEKV